MEVHINPFHFLDQPLEDEHLVPIVTLSWELIPLDVGPIANDSELCNAIQSSANI